MQTAQHEYFSDYRSLKMALLLRCSRIAVWCAPVPGFLEQKIGILGALSFCSSMISTVTIIPFMPDGWAPTAGGFPAMTERVAFLMKDLVIFAASFYLLKQDVMRVKVGRRRNDVVVGTSRAA